jgi:hypothetical protein
MPELQSPEFKPQSHPTKKREKITPGDYTQGLMLAKQVLYY